MMATLSSLDPPSMTTTSRRGYCCRKMLSTASTRKRPWLYEGTTTRMHGSWEYVAAMPIESLRDFTSRKRKRRFSSGHPSLTLPARRRVFNNGEFLPDTASDSKDVGTGRGRYCDNAHDEAPAARESAGTT